MTFTHKPLDSLQEMEEELAKPDDLENIQLEISEVAKQHLLDLERLYAFHAGEHYDEHIDRYLTKDDTQVLVEGENNPIAVASYNRLEVRGEATDQILTFDAASNQELYEDTRTMPDLVSLWEDDLALMRHTHLRHLHSLYQKRTEMENMRRQEEAQEEEARRRQEAQFPSSIEDFQRKSKDVQHRAARFLVLDDDTRREKMLSEYGWAWRQVKPLLEEMSHNVMCSFNGSFVVC